MYFLLAFIWLKFCQYSVVCHLGNFFSRNGSELVQKCSCQKTGFNSKNTVQDFLNKDPMMLDHSVPD